MMVWSQERLSHRLSRARWLHSLVLGVVAACGNPNEVPPTPSRGPVIPEGQSLRRPRIQA